MKFLQLPFFRELEPACNVLLAGAGGGFDIFSGLPLYFGLRNAGKHVYLANLSFSYLGAAKGRMVGPTALEITADSGCAGYFPEYYLAQWFREQSESAPIYCFERSALVQPLLASYRALVRELDIDTVILIDGGTDSLMRGDEAGLGTPEEDMSSIAAVDELTVARKFLVCLGFGVDSFHGVCHAHAFEAVAELTRQGAFLGAFTLLQDMPEVQRYLAATEAVLSAMADHPSIVSTSILSALEGRYGDFQRNERTRDSTLWINPLMTLYWAFRLEAVARRILYLDAIKPTQSCWEVMSVIDVFRQQCTVIRERTTIPDNGFGRKLSR